MSPRKNRRWIWYFVILLALALAATVVLIVYNLKQQLTPGQLEAARQLWKEKGPRNYTMGYTTRKNDEPDEDHFWVQVRGGRAVLSKYNGNPEEPAKFRYRTMDALFDDMDRFMQMDQAKGSRKAFVRAIFDDQKTGGLRWYVHRVMGTNQRAEITVKSFSIDQAE